MSSDATITGTSASDSVAADTDTDHGADRAGHSRHKEPTDRQYIGIALFLAVLTALEVAATEVGWLDGPLLVVSLVVLMVLKFAVVVLYFMHLRFDSRLFSLVFYVGLFLTAALYVTVLATFHFFSN